MSDGEQDVKRLRRSTLRLMLMITFGMGEVVGLLIGASEVRPAYAAAVIVVGSAVFWLALPSYRDGKARE